MQKHGVFPKLYGIAGVLSYLIYCCFFTNHEHYVRGHYSRDSARDGMRRQLQDMLDSADDDTIRSAIQRCMDVLEDERG